MRPMISTLTCSRAADVNAVHPHVNIILHVTALLIIIENKASISPQVKPVSFPPAQYSTFNIKKLQSEFIHTGFQTKCHNVFTIWIRQYLSNAVRTVVAIWILTLSMEPTTLHHSHLGSNTYNNKYVYMRQCLITASVWSILRACYWTWLSHTNLVTVVNVNIRPQRYFPNKIWKLF